jgi:hypothetical protein
VLEPVGDERGDRRHDSDLSVQAGELPYSQRFFPGTTAWRIAYRRRDAVEGVDGALKGTFVNIGQKFF